LVSVSDRTDLPGLHDVFHAILGWSGAISAISFAKSQLTMIGLLFASGASSS